MEEDADDPEFRRPQDYCEHGTYIGNPYGADILCHACEMGYTPEQVRMSAFWQRQSLRRQRRERLRIARDIITNIPNFSFGKRAFFLEAATLSESWKTFHRHCLALERIAELREAKAAS